MKTLLAMLNDGLIYLTMMRMMKGCFQWARTKKKLVFSQMNEEEILRKNLWDFEQKHGHTYLMDDDSEQKKQEQKSV